VQYRDLGSKEVKVKSSWFTVEGNIEPPIRSYEVAGLAENHNYRSSLSLVTTGQLKFSGSTAEGNNRLPFAAMQY
jgi:hypothetical protein